MSLILAMLAPLALSQVAPRVSPGAAPPLNLPDVIDPRRPARRPGTTQPVARMPTFTPSRLQECLQQVQANAGTGAEAARAWLAQAKGSASAEPQLCLGLAQAELGEWEEAEAAFIAGRDVAAANEAVLKARLGAMAGNAALAQDEPERALVALDAAAVVAKAQVDTELAGDIALDRARALVALKRDGEAATALDEARSAAPGNAAAWLLSATLSRRMAKLAEAQRQIEQAAVLAPLDAEVGLEAGVIAMLAGREDAARRSWQSVVAASPTSDAGIRAKAYLDQTARATTPGP